MSDAGLPVWVWYYTMALTIGVALENLGVSYFEFWPKSKWKCSIVMNFLFSAKLFVLCLFHECVNTRSWRALFVRFWFIYVKVSVCYLFVLQYTFLFLDPDCLKTVVYNQCIFKNHVQFRMRNVHDFWIYVCYYTCTYRRKVYTVWTVNDVLGRIRIRIPWIDINI